jgi:hypothetical protein
VHQSMVKSPNFVDQVARQGISVFASSLKPPYIYCVFKHRLLGFSRMVSLISTTRSLDQFLYIDLVVLKVPITFQKWGQQRESLPTRRKPFHRIITFPAEHFFLLAPLQLSLCQPSQELEQSTGHPKADSRVNPMA